MYNFTDPNFDSENLSYKQIDAPCSAQTEPEMY